jgi:hypothetical protein
VGHIPENHKGSGMGKREKNIWPVLNVILLSAILGLGILYWFRLQKLENALESKSTPEAVLPTPTSKNSVPTTTPAEVQEKDAKETVVLPAKAVDAPVTVADRGPLGRDWQDMGNLPFEAGRGPGVVEFKDRLWVVGGLGRQEAWSSSDGVHWDRAASAIGPSAGSEDGLAVFQGRLWVAGGTTPTVMSSTDGVHWEKMTDQAAFGARTQARLSTFDGRLWIIGGNQGGVSNDVWSSRDGKNWECVTHQAPFPPRRVFNALVFDGKLWVLGGFKDSSYDLLDDVWCSTDGAHWDRVDASPHFQGRTDFAAFSSLGRIWVIGGDVGSFIWKSDVWSSFDGIHWDLLKTAIPGFTGIGSQGCFFKGRLWIVGGDSGKIWCSPPG